MFSFDKRLRYQDNTRRFSIIPIAGGWEVREERDSEVVKKLQLQDWHRVERARRTFTIELDKLQQNGWAAD